MITQNIAMLPVFMSLLIISFLLFAFLENKMQNYEKYKKEIPLLERFFYQSSKTMVIVSYCISIITTFEFWYLYILNL
jgi:hypothetical protein